MHKSNQTQLSVRMLVSTDDYRACVRMQQDTWGDDFSEFVPSGIIKIIQKVGGVAAGAFDQDDCLVGFVLGISGVRHDRPAHWSHMLAVAPSLRDTGLGRRLKEFQRESLLQLGIRTMYWTFDPLVARNAHFNLNKLGTEIDEYAESMYGEGDRGILDSVIGTDRFITSWDLQTAVPRSPCVFAESQRTCNTTLGDAGPRPTAVVVGPEPVIYLEVPETIHNLKDSDPDLAVTWRRNTREAFMTSFATGYRVEGFGRSPGGRCCYRLEKDDTSD